MDSPLILVSYKFSVLRHGKFFAVESRATPLFPNAFPAKFKFLNLSQDSMLSQA